MAAAFAQCLAVLSLSILAGVQTRGSQVRYSTADRLTDAEVRSCIAYGEREHTQPISLIDRGTGSPWGNVYTPCQLTMEVARFAFESKRRITTEEIGPELRERGFWFVVPLQDLGKAALDGMPRPSSGIVVLRKGLAAARLDSIVQPKVFSTILARAFGEETAIAMFPSELGDESTVIRIEYPLSSRELNPARITLVAPIKVNGPVPKMPQAVRASRTDEVYIDATIGIDGRLKNLKIARHGDKAEDEASLEAARQWEFKPGLINGAPFAFETTVRFTFRTP